MIPRLVCSRSLHVAFITEDEKIFEIAPQILDCSDWGADLYSLTAFHDLEAHEFRMIHEGLGSPEISGVVTDLDLHNLCESYGR